MKRIYDPVALGLDVAKVSNGEAYVICPFHGDHKPSASFNVQNGLFVCYACGANSNASSLSRILGGNISFVTNEFLISKTTSRVSEEKEWRWVLSCEQAIDNPYLKSRGVSNSQVKAFDIRQFDFGVAFIFKNKKGVPIGTQLRLTASDVQNRYIILGEKPPMWPMPSELSSSQAILVEGPFGVLKANGYGVENVFAVIGAQSVVRTSMSLFGLRRKIVVFDDDQAGHIASAKALSLKQGFSAFVPGTEADEETLGFYEDLVSGKLDMKTSLSELELTQKEKAAVNHFLSKTRRKFVNSGYVHSGRK